MAVDPQRVRNSLKRISADPYDLEAWMLVVKDAQTRRIDDSRETFEALIKLFPTSGRFWKIYIEQEMRGRNFEKVEKVRDIIDIECLINVLFQRSLMKVLNIDLWKTYLLYVKETKASLPNYKEKMAQAYDFALEKMGLDITSFPIWNDYIRFLKGVEAVGSYAENQKISAIRKVYQKGIVNPMINIETLWKEYVVFEQGINPIIAEKMTAERSRDYMNARRVAKEYEAVTRGLNKSAPCVPPTGSQEEMKQLDLWQKYIAWERSNPLRVEDQVLITKRVMFAYEQCLLCLGHHANVWYEATVFLQESSKLLQDKGDVDSSKMFQELASTLYDRATSGVLSKSMLLHLAHAEFEEQMMRNDRVHQIYKKYLDMEDIDPTLCYIQYMKYCRRAEGTSSARAVFKRAREDPRTSYHVYVAAALMEYYCTKDKKIAANVFELGFKKFKANEQFVLAYVDYLSHLNEDNNTRVLFERSLTSGSLKPKQQIEIWNKFLEFEANVGDMGSILKVEKRRALALEGESDSSETGRLIQRYKFLDLFPCSKEELRILGYVGVDATISPLPAQMMANGGSVSAAAGVGGGGGVGIAAGVDAASAGGATGDGGIGGGAGDGLPRPDTSQMIPFRPKIRWIPGEHPLPGGGFPPPPAVAEMLLSLPPPTSFNGPFVIIDRLVEVFTKVKLPDEFKVTGSSSNGHSTKLFETARAAAPLGGGGPETTDRKRKSRRGDSEDEDDNSSGLSSAPANDIYRKRQQKKMR